jgi:hypothetical protein
MRNGFELGGFDRKVSQECIRLFPVFLEGIFVFAQLEVEVGLRGEFFVIRFSMKLT